MTAATLPGGPLGARLGGKKSGVKGRLIQGLAWTSLILGVAAGSLLASTFIGGIIDNIFTATPLGWLPVLILAGLFVMTAVDLIHDGVPNQVALYSVMAMPTVARSVNGKLGANVESWAGQVRSHLFDNGPLSAWLGTSSAIGLALAASVCAWLVARRTMKAKAG